jgi:hypothetical protein
LLLLALGLASWPLAKARPWLGSALVGALALLSLYGVVGVIQPSFAPSPSPTIRELAQAEPADDPIRFGEIELSHWTLYDEPTLYWRATQPPTQDWRTALRVTAEDGTLVWEWRRSPGYGRFSSDFWRSGTVVRDEYVVQWPEWADPGRYRVEVTLYPFDGEPGKEYHYVLLGWLDID